MPLKNIIQPEIIDIDEELRLKKYDEDEWKIALSWYQNPNVVYYCDGVNATIYDNDKLYRMYRFLDNLGELYFIEILEDKKWKPIGDVTLSEENMPIVIGEEDYWSRGIGKRVINVLIVRAESIGLKKIYIPAIYLYNERSQKLFASMGFTEVAENDTEKSYELILALKD